MTTNNTEADSDAGGGFSESWLTLREPADHAARSSELNNSLVSWCLEQQALQVVELGAGTGSNLRFLMPQLGHNQQWRLIDNDAALLNHLPAILQPWADSCAARILAENGTLLIEHDAFSASVSTEVMDLANNLQQLSMQGVHLVCASALLDLTSQSWLDELARLASTHHCACLFVLNYNGKIQWQPEHQADATVTTLLNQHQLGNKGFGAALGPKAGLHMARALEVAGRRIRMADSDWVLDEQSCSLQQAIVDGWAPAAIEQDEQTKAMVDQWHGMRRQYIEQGRSTLTVGHNDVLSLPV